MPYSYCSYYYPLFSDLKNAAGNNQRCQRSTSYSGEGWNPNIDIYFDKDSVSFYAELPGLKKDQINIDIKDHVLTISGEKVNYLNKSTQTQSQASSPSSEALGEFTSIASEKDANNNQTSVQKSESSPSSEQPTATNKESKIEKINSEISFGKFSRSFRLGDDVDVQTATATHQDGVLTIKFQRSAPQTWKVNIQ